MFVLSAPPDPQWQNVKTNANCSCDTQQQHQSINPHTQTWHKAPSPFCISSTSIRGVAHWYRLSFITSEALSVNHLVIKFTFYISLYLYCKSISFIMFYILLRLYEMCYTNKAASLKWSIGRIILMHDVIIYTKKLCHICSYLFICRQMFFLSKISFTFFIFTYVPVHLIL